MVYHMVYLRDCSICASVVSLWCVSKVEWADIVVYSSIDTVTSYLFILSIIESGVLKYSGFTV